jgi:hypothetical protein
MIAYFIQKHPTTIVESQGGMDQMLNGFLSRISMMENMTS